MELLDLIEDYLIDNEEGVPSTSEGGESVRGALEFDELQGISQRALEEDQDH